MAAPASVEQQPDWYGSAIDLGDNWSKIPAGVVTISDDLTLAVTVNYHGKRLEETSKARCQQGFTCVVTAPAATPRMVQPNKDDLAAAWSATVFLGGTHTGIQITRSQQSGSRVFARAAIIDTRGRHEIGTATMEDVTGVIWLSAPLEIPQGKFQIELVPAPLDAAGGWDISPILNQTIKITNISRSPNAMP
jgi:hypothetical protein